MRKLREGNWVRGEGREKEEGRKRKKKRAMEKKDRGREIKVEEVSSGKERVWKVAFWNVAGVGNKDKEF